MLLKIEAEAYEQNRVQAERQAEAPTQTIAPMTEERTPELAGEDTPQPEPTHTTEARQEGTALATTNTTPEQQEEETTLPKLTNNHQWFGLRWSKLNRLQFLKPEPN